MGKSPSSARTVSHCWNTPVPAEPSSRFKQQNNKKQTNKKKNSRSLSTHGIIFKLSLTGRNAVQRFPWRCTYSQIYLHSRKCSSVNATPLPTILTTFQLKLCNLSFCTTKKYSSLPPKKKKKKKKKS